MLRRRFRCSRGIRTSGAPDTATPQQKFPVMVSLNTMKIDSGTTIVSAPDQQDGELMISLPQGMTSILIEVDLVAPQMTATDGVLTKTDRANSGSEFDDGDISNAGRERAVGVEPIFATLTYNGAFLATIQRDVTVAAQQVADLKLTSAAPPMVTAPKPVEGPRSVRSPDAMKPNPCLVPESGTPLGVEGNGSAAG